MSEITNYMLSTYAYFVNSIIQLFEEFVRIGINLENYTNTISVTVEDIVFRGESVSVALYDLPITMT